MDEEAPIISSVAARQSISQLQDLVFSYTLGSLGRNSKTLLYRVLARLPEETTYCRPMLRSGPTTPVPESVVPLASP
jgi:hypothetical protein